MKTILVATDFSKASHNAIDYAVEIALAAKAKLILFHAYHVPVVTTDLPVVMPSLDELEADTLAGLMRIKNELHGKHDHRLELDCVSVCGFAADTIERYADNHNIDLIVMGMKGAGLLSEVLIGSVTTSVIHNTKYPVLVVGEKVEFRTPKKIVLAADFDEIAPDTLQPVKKIAGLFDSHIYVLNVVENAELVPEMKDAVAGIKLDRSLEGTNHSFHVCENDYVVEGINEFISLHEIDLVVMIPRKHSLLEKIFTGSQSKRMAFHSTIPLLTLFNQK